MGGKHSTKNLGKWIGVKGEKNPNWKPKLKKVCIGCGKEFEFNCHTRSRDAKYHSHKCYLKYRSGFHTGKKHTETTKDKIRQYAIKRIGNKNGNWKGGITTEYSMIRNSDKYFEWRQRIFIRDDFTCKKCGDKTGGNLEAHHKKPFAKLLEEVKKYLPLLNFFEACMLYTPLWDLDNGITYCGDCHKHMRRK